MSRLEYLKRMFFTMIEDIMEEWELILSLFMISFVLMFFSAIYLS